MKDKKLHRMLVNKASSVVQALDGYLVTDELRPHYQRFIRKMFGPRARSLGLAARKKDDADTRMLRGGLIYLVAQLGEDAKLIAQARKLALAWLDDPKRVDADMVGTVLAIAARHGDQKLYDRLRAKLDDTHDGERRSQILRAMAGFSDPAIVEQALGLVLSDQLEYDEAMTIYWGTFADRKSRELAFAWIQKSYDALVARLPGDQGAYLPYAGAQYCDAEHRAEVEAFFAQRVDKFEGGPRVLAQVLEGIDLCIASRSRQEAAVAAFLEKY